MRSKLVRRAATPDPGGDLGIGNLCQAWPKRVRVTSFLIHSEPRSQVSPGDAPRLAQGVPGVEQFPVGFRAEPGVFTADHGDRGWRSWKGASFGQAVARRIERANLIGLILAPEER